MVTSERRVCVLRFRLTAPSLCLAAFRGRVYADGTQNTVVPKTGGGRIILICVNGACHM